MKIILVGTAAQWREAPFDDPNCEIWVTGGIWGLVPRLDRYWEIHGTRTIEEIYLKEPGWLEFVQKLGPRFICKDADPRWPDATVFDFQTAMKEFGTFFTSSISWMLATAILAQAKEIGVFGVNAAHGTEYGYQKPALCYFMGIALGKGIKVSVPETSELFKTPWIYAYEEPPPILKAMAEKKRQMGAKLKEQEFLIQNATENKGYCRGALEMIEHFSNNFGGV